MKTLLLIFMILTMSGAVETQDYPKKIIFGTFTQKKYADGELNLFRADANYEKLYNLALKNGFAIHSRPLAEYTILAIEPINQKSAFFEAYDLIKTRYPRAYHISAEGFNEKIEKPLPPKSRNKPPATAPVSDNTINVATADKPIFKVKEMKAEMMLVNYQTTNEKVEKIKDILQEKQKPIMQQTPKTEVKKEEQKPKQEDKGTSDEAEVPELERSDAPKTEGNVPKVVQTETSANMQKTEVEGDVPELSDTLKESPKSKEAEDKTEEALKVLTAKKTENQETLEVAKAEEVKESNATVNEESVQGEDSYFTLTNFMILLILVGLGFGYIKFKKVYDEY